MSASLLEQLAPPLALLGVLVTNNDPPDNADLYSKDKLFGALRRLPRELLLEQLCKRLDIATVVVKRKCEPFDRLLGAVAAVGGWTLVEKGGGVYLPDKNQAAKIEEWPKTAPFQVGAVKQLAQTLLQRVNAAQKVGAGAVHVGSEDEEPAKFSPANAVATMRGVTVVQVAAEDKPGEDAAPAESKPAEGQKVADKPGAQAGGGRRHAEGGAGAERRLWQARTTRRRGRMWRRQKASRRRDRRWRTSRRSTSRQREMTSRRRRRAERRLWRARTTRRRGRTQHRQMRSFFLARSGSSRVTSGRSC